MKVTYLSDVEPGYKYPATSMAPTSRQTIVADKSDFDNVRTGNYRRLNWFHRHNRWWCAPATICGAKLFPRVCVIIPVVGQALMITYGVVYFVFGFRNLIRALDSPRVKHFFLGPNEDEDNE